jgi:hypothetical protein
VIPDHKWQSVYKVHRHWVGTRRELNLKIWKKIRVVVLKKSVRPVSSAGTLDCGIRNVAIQIDSKLKDSFLGILVDDCSKESKRYAWS